MNRVLITGHTGFKGSWLVQRLALEGHVVAGFSLPPTTGSHFDIANTGEMLSMETFGDIRDRQLLSKIVQDFRPDRIVHFAAQSLVTLSIQQPYETLSVNIEGTNCVLATALELEVERALIVTSDKVYLDLGDRTPRTEKSQLGGWDPYSASKASADIAAQSWMRLGSSCNISIVRGGNVIGGGDRGLNRLIPDFERSLQSKVPLVIRNPSQIRPWQHVLDCLDGYLQILESPASAQNQIWNVGPELSESRLISVLELIEFYAEARGRRPRLVFEELGIKETEYLSIDSSKVSEVLGWRPAMGALQKISKVAEWESEVSRDIGGAGRMTRVQIEDYLNSR